MDTLEVCSVTPFWRFAVGPTSKMSPAIPYFRYSKAKKFFEKVKREIPWSGVALYKRCGRHGFEVVEEHKGDIHATL